MSPLRSKTWAFLTLVLSVAILALSGCDSTSLKRPSGGEVVIPEKTEVLEDSTMQNLTSASEDFSTLTFSQSSATLEELEAGNIIASGPANNAPAGLLRKVTSVEDQNGSVIVRTEVATLEEAIEQGSFEISRTLTPDMMNSEAAVLRKGVSMRSSKASRYEFSMVIDDVVLYDEDDNSSTTDDQIEANGEISFTPSFDIGGEIGFFEIESFSFSHQLDVGSELNVEARVNIAGAEKEVTIAEFPRTTVVIQVGPLPVVVQPKLSLEVDLEGNVSAGLTTDITQESSAEMSVSYENDSWNGNRNFDGDGSFTAPTADAQAEFEAAAGPSLQLLLYGVAGPFAEGEGYADLEVTPVADPWWQLKAGLQAAVGAEVELIGRSLARYETTFETTLFQREADGTFTPPGRIRGSVTDAATEQPLGDVTIEVHDANGNVEGMGSTDQSGNYQILVPEAEGYTVSFSKEGYLPVTYDNVSVVSDQDTNLEPVLQVDEDDDGTGVVKGRVVDATNGNGVQDVEILLRAGVNDTTSSVVATTTTNGQGQYQFSGLEAGNYTAEAWKSGYSTAFFTFVCLGDQTRTVSDAAITPEAESGTMRIVLSWGETPDDLDSHLTGPTGDGDRFHVFYANLVVENANLDRDDVTSFGPETITIETFEDGLYRYSVHDYTNRNASQSFALSESGAQVNVYQGDTLVKTFNVPTNTEGTLWTVFEMENNEITPINNLSYESDPPDVNSISKNKQVATDAQLLRDLPSKE
jgi:hypothetical protein